MDEFKMMVFGRNQFALFLSEKTEMPLIALCIVKENSKKPIHLMKHEEFRIVALGCVDPEEFMHIPEGRFKSMDDIMNIPAINDVMSHFVPSAEHWEGAKKAGFGLRLIMTDKKSLADAGQLSAQPSAKIKKWCEEIVDSYILEHKPPVMPGFSFMHSHMHAYTQSLCYIYTKALLDIDQSLRGAWVEHEEFSHALAVHQNGDVEDVWGRRSFSSVVENLTKIYPNAQIQLNYAKFDEAIKNHKHLYGDKELKAALREAKNKAFENPRSSVCQKKITPRM